MDRIEKLILGQAERTPDAVAVEHNGARLSYADLRSRARQVTVALEGLGLRPGETVMVCQERSLETAPLVVGIWDAGGVVVPVNPNVPSKMLEWVIRDSRPRIVITDASVEDRIKCAVGGGDSGAAPVVVTGVPDDSGKTDSRAANTEGVAEGGVFDEDACYVIYTSGSEGRPKGVLGSHRSLTRYVRWQAEAFSTGEKDRFSQTAHLSFDFSLKELLVPLTRGACVCVADRDKVMDAERFLKWVYMSRITVMCCVPTLVRSILQLPEAADAARSLRSVRQLLISGDMLRWEDVTGWRKRFGSSMSLFNLYGPTESTVIKFYYPIPEERSPESVNVPVGRPIEGADVLILDEGGRPCPDGQTGEVVILSEWLARGYVNESQAGGGAFCVLEHEGKSKRVYKTGDLGRMLGGGNLELVGRRDRQVKIRGHRIELDGIESILSERAGLRDAAAVVACDSDADAVEDSTLVACFFTADDPALTEKEMTAYAKERLPPQVISLTRFKRLEELPLTTNGKVDRLRLKSLAEQAVRAARAAESHDAPLTVRQRMSRMWEELLSVDGVDAEANFFQLGGDSMTAIRLLRRLRDELHPEIKLGDLYNYPSFSQLSDRVERLITGGQ
ncbi:MAG: amino acid adenylation domain-containing protein [Pyrinomonadaceae bacterium]